MNEPKPFDGKLVDAEVLAWSAEAGKYRRISVRTLTEEIALEVIRQLSRELEGKVASNE